MLVSLLRQSGFLLKLLYAVADVGEFLAHGGKVGDVVADTVKARVHVLEAIVYFLLKRAKALFGRQWFQIFL